MGGVAVGSGVNVGVGDGVAVGSTVGVGIGIGVGGIVAVGTNVGGAALPHATDKSSNAPNTNTLLIVIMHYLILSHKHSANYSTVGKNGNNCGIRRYETPPATGTFSPCHA